MTYAHCHRCQADLPQHDEGTLIFCTHCGAAQVTLSEELQHQLELQAAAAEGAEDAAPSQVVRSTVWTVALRCVALAAAIAAGLTLVSFAVPFVLLLDWLWAMVSPVVVIGIFQARAPLAPMTTGFGARLGLVTGLAIAVALGVVNTVFMVIARRIHQMGDFDARMNVAVEQWKTQISAQPDAAGLSLVHSLTLPEFRAGMLLTGVAMMVLLLLALTTAGGAFAGFVRSRKRA